MASIIERLAKRFARKPSLLAPDAEKSAKTIAPYATALRQSYIQGSQKQGARLLRQFSERCEFVRMAINRRKHQISQAPWHLVRLDDPKKPVDPKVDQAVRDLLKFVNPKRESFRSLLDQVLEDLLVLDAGCIEKEKTVGGEIHALYAVDGATIRVDPTWNGDEPNEPRYSQYVNFQKTADLRNDELIYIMATPRTYSAIGLSPVETLINVIEAELYGEEYSFDQLKNAAPAGILDLGPSLTQEQVDGFREYYEQEIAGSKSLAIFGGGMAGGGVKWNPFSPTNRDQQLMDYKHWLAIKIAGVFELDPLTFNLTAGVNRSTGKSLQTRTDEGHVALAKLIQEALTRELVWEIDENHGFEFGNLTDRDEAAQADVDVKYMGIGVTTPNEIRAREGLDPVPWGDVPFVNVQVGPEGEVVQPGQGTQDDPNEPAADDASKPPKNDDGGKDGEDKNKSLPFEQAGRVARLTRSARLGYLNV